jgi:hypothetical protein
MLVEIPATAAKYGKLADAKSNNKKSFTRVVNVI